jgi:hypothetical protein
MAKIRKVASGELSSKSLRAEDYVGEEVRDLGQAKEGFAPALVDDEDVHPLIMEAPDEDEPSPKAGVR